MGDEDSPTWIDELSARAKTLSMEQAFDVLWRSIQDLLDPSNDWQFSEDDAVASLALMDEVIRLKNRVKEYEGALTRIFEPYERAWTTEDDLSQKNMDVLYAVSEAHASLHPPEEGDDVLDNV